MSRKLSLPNFRMFPSFQTLQLLPEWRTEGTTAVTVSEWELGRGACKGTLTTGMRGTNSLIPLCFHNSSVIFAALYLGKGLQPA